MTAYNFGDVVLVGFPHTDLRSVSKRPAFVIYDADDLDILGARITTQEYTTKADYKIVEWRQSGLIAESFVRLGKQATSPFPQDVVLLPDRSPDQVKTQNNPLAPSRFRLFLTGEQTLCTFCTDVPSRSPY